MAQVVTNENMVEFINNRSVPEFVAPKADEPAPTPTPPVDKTPAPAVQRDPTSGKFVAKDAPAADAPTEPTKPAAPEAADEGDEDDKDLPERVRRQIGRKHRQMKEAEEFAADEARRALKAEAKAAAYEAELETLRTKSGPPAPKTPAEGEPKPEDFKTVAEYVDALTDWKLDQKQKIRDEANAKQQAEQAAKAVESEFQKRVVQAAKEIPDYADVIAEADVMLPGHMVQFIAESELGPKLGYHLAKNRGELDRIAGLSPVRAVAELGKLEAQLEKPAAATPPAARANVSKAPAPISPLNGGDAPSHKDPSQMSFKELRALREAERAAGKRH